MSEALKHVESRLKDLQSFQQKRVEYYNQVTKNIKQLKSESKLVLKQLSEVNGAIQAYVESIRLMNEDLKAAQAVAVEAPVDVAVEAEQTSEGA